MGETRNAKREYMRGPQKGDTCTSRRSWCPQLDRTILPIRELDLANYRNTRKCV